VSMKERELENIFKENLEDYKKDFGFVCFFGNLNLKDDLDVFISPSKKCKKGYFLKQLVSFLEKIEGEIEKRRGDLLVIWHSTYEEEVEYLNTKKNALRIHLSSFPDIHPVIIPNYLSVLENAERVLLGNYETIEEMKKTKLDYFYNYLFVSNCLLSNYPEELEEKKVSSKVNYIYKHIIENKKGLSGSAKKQFFECCDFLDKMAY